MLIVGLGNPENQYKLNRHNVGFMFIDLIINEISTSNISKKDFKGELFKSKDVYFLKPNTYMNLSGDSVINVINFFKINLEDVLVVHDDIDLSLGALKYKIGGSSGGHNGLKSIDNRCGVNYKRARFGIGRPLHKSQVSSYVLSDFSVSEKDILDESLTFLKEGILKYIVDRDFDKLKLKFSKNNKQQ